MRGGEEGRLAVLLEAAPAVHRTVAAGLEGHLGLHAAVGADHRVHLPGGRRGAVAAAVRAGRAAARLLLAGVAAGLAALGLAGEALLRVELLLLGREVELRAAVHARDDLIG